MWAVLIILTLCFRQRCQVFMLCISLVSSGLALIYPAINSIVLFVLGIPATTLLVLELKRYLSFPVVAQQRRVLHHTTLPRLPVPSVRPARHSRRPRGVGPPTKLGSSVVECRTHNQERLCSNPPLLLCRRLGIFVLSIDAPVHSAV